MQVEIGALVSILVSVAGAASLIATMKVNARQQRERVRGLEARLAEQGKRMGRIEGVLISLAGRTGLDVPRLLERLDPERAPTRPLPMFTALGVPEPIENDETSEG